MQGSPRSQCSEERYKHYVMKLYPLHTYIIPSSFTGNMMLPNVTDISGGSRGGSLCSKVPPLLLIEQ